MTKSDLAREVLEKVGLPKKEAANMVEMVFNVLKATLAEGKTIKISGFGTFIVRKRGIRKGRNLKTGVEILIEPRKVVTFKPSLQFKEMLHKD